MLKKIFKGLSFLYVTLPIKGLLSNLGYKQLKKNLDFNKTQFKQLTNPVCPQCFNNVVKYQTTSIKQEDPKAEKKVLVELSCVNSDLCSFKAKFTAQDNKSAIKKGMADQIVKFGEKKRESIITQLTPEFINTKINEHFQIAQTLKWLAIFCFIASIAAYFFYSFLAGFVWILFGLGIALLALKSSFRCWQAQTLNVYQSKNLFGFWFKNISWFAKPQYLKVSKKEK